MSDLDLDATAIESLYARGVTDGLPVVPPTRALVERARRGDRARGRRAGGDRAPNYGRATVEKIAINAVMAGCRPEYLPVVVAAVEAVCDEAFDLHGVSATTNAPSPLVIVNGPIRARLEINSGAGVFGPGWRANATIGRAVRLVCSILGGARRVSSACHPRAPGRSRTASGERGGEPLGSRSRSSTGSRPARAPSRCSPPTRRSACTRSGAARRRICCRRSPRVWRWCRITR